MKRLSITVYGKAGNRLRDPAKTKYEIYLDVVLTNGSRAASATFGKARGEGRESDAKIEKAKDKAIDWAKKPLM